MRPLGLALIFLGLAAPIPGFIAASPPDGRDVLALTSQYLGATSLIAMAILQILATRAPGVEMIFGGLDRVYVLHKWMGAGALAALLLHDTIDAEMRGLAAQGALSEIAETLGEISLYGFVILVAITALTFTPYRLWRLSHRFMGLFFVAASAHFALIDKPFSTLDPLGLYIAAFCLAGALAFGWTQIPTDLKPARRYKVASLGRDGGVTVVELAPEGRPLRWRPGQFAFLRFNAPDLDEPHPLTISAAPGADGALRFSVKPDGDWTEALGARVTTGMEARVQGPYGRFERPRRAGREVWIAAGVGATPFAAWTGALDGLEPEIDLFFAVRARDAAPLLAEFEAAARERPDFRLHLIESARGERISAAEIARIVGPELVKSHVAYCGPRALRETLQRDFRGMGLPRGRFAYELFELRGGFGLRKLGAWLAARFEEFQARRRARA